MTIHDKPDAGLYCPRCHSRWVPVQRTKHLSHGRILRYRTCQHCGKRFTTFERIGGSK